LREYHPQLAEKYFAIARRGAIPLDIGVIASACNPRNRNKSGYVAFIYADGDGVGSFVESCSTRNEYQEMSQALRDATWYAVTFALANNLAIQPLDNPMSPDETEEQRRRPTQPFEIITVGGDDVMLLVPAHVALQVARDMAVKFTEYLEKEGIKGKDRPLTLSSGVVIAPQHMPVRLMRDFARELLKKGAKPRAKETQFAAVDFQIFTSAAVYGSDIMSMRARPPYSIRPLDNSDEKPLHLYCRPYTIPELSRLLDALQELNDADFATSQLYPLAGALERGRRRATLFYLYQRSRIKDKKHRAALAKVEAIIEAQVQRDPLPWYKADPGATYTFNTTLRDVAELYDFVAAGEEVTV
jgi:CRISPR-associated protein Cmr2